MLLIYSSFGAGNALSLTVLALAPSKMPFRLRFRNLFEKSPVESKDVKGSSKTIRCSKGVLGKSGRPERSKYGEALGNQQRKIIWKIKRVLSKTVKGN